MGWGYNPLILTFDPNNGTSKIWRFGSLFLVLTFPGLNKSLVEKKQNPYQTSDFHKGKIHVSTPKAIQIG